MRRDGELARAVAVEHGLPPAPIREVKGAGSVNHVFVVGSGVDQWVIRFAKDPLAPDVFDAEAWSATRATERGVPTPVVTSTGILHGAPYGVQRFVSGPSVPDDDLAVWSVLGSYARTINEIQPTSTAPRSLFSRFGRDLQQAWTSHVQYNLEQLNTADPLLLLRHGVYDHVQQRRLATTLLELQRLPMRFGLCHGDLTPRNLIASEPGPLALIDWGSASFGPVPWSELLVIDRDVAQRGSAASPRLDAFMQAVGVNPETAWPTFEKFRLLQRLDLVRWATQKRPDRLSDAIADLALLL